MAGLRRDIGLIGAAFIALNGIIGAGIFAMPQALAEGAGAASPYLILIFGAAMLSLALVLGELAGKFDAAGGPVVYANAAFGRFIGFQAGWLYYLARLSAIAANTNALITYIAVFAPGADQGVLRLGLIVALLAGLCAINIVGVKAAVRTLNLVTLAKVAPLIALVGWGLIAYGQSLPPAQAPSLSAAEGVGLLLLYAFVGFEQVTLTAGETREAKRAVPRAMVSVVMATAVLYFLVQLTYMAVMDGRTPEGAPLAAAAEILAGPWGAAAITAAALISIGGNVFASSIATPRITYAMGEEGSLPAWFAGLSARFATPVNSIVLLGLIAGALAVSGAFVWLAIMSALARLIVYLVCVGAVLKLRRGEAKAVRGPAAMAVRWMAPPAAAVLCVWAAAQASPQAWLVVGGFLLAGAALYALARWRGGRPSPR